MITLAALLLLALAAPTAAQAASRTIDPAELAQVRMINRFRAAHHLAPVRIDGRLSTTAAWMARDMGAKHYFSHTDSRSRDPFQRMRAFGYPSANTWRGENIAAGNAAVGATYQQWLTSPPHKATWMVGRYRAIGIARVFVPGSPYGWYWVTDFGSRYVSAPA
ncbi:MAG: SCP-like extracellular [Thermoleophilia bacterium]|nr:SCP-like extracellular [Thermoleophilia bacterium]